MVSFERDPDTFLEGQLAREPADTLPPSFAEPPLSDDLQPSSAVSSPTQPGPVLYMPSAAGDSVPVSPSSPHAPDLSAVRACPGGGWAPCLPRSQHPSHLLTIPSIPSQPVPGKEALVSGLRPRDSALSVPGFFSLSKSGEGWGTVFLEPWKSW